MPFFDIRGTAPKFGVNPNKLLKRIQAAIADEVKNEALALYEKTVETWTHQPTFKAVETSRGARIDVGSVSYRGRRIPLYKFIDKGTKSRHAVMSQGFRPKTKPGTIASYAGSGGFKYFSPFARKPIEPRRFSEIIAERMQKRINKGIREAIRNGLLEKS